MVVTNDDRLAMSLRLLRNHGEKSVETLAPDLDVPRWGLNLRMTELQAAVGIAQLKKLDRLTERRSYLGNLLRLKLKKFEGLSGPHKQSFTEPVFYSYLIDYDEEFLGVSLQTFVDALRAEGAPFGANWTVPVYWYPPFPKRSMYPKKKCPFDCEHTKRYVDYSMGICPVAEACYQKTLFFNMQLYNLNDELIEQVCQVFEKIYANLTVLREYDKRIKTQILS
jgi:perosamine synthetase